MRELTEVMNVSENLLVPVDSSTGKKIMGGAISQLLY